MHRDYVLPNTDPKITLYIHPPSAQTAILPISFTGVIIDVLQYLLYHVITTGWNGPIPAEGLIFNVGDIWISAKSANVAVGAELDCWTLGQILNAVGSLVTKHGYRTWNFDILQGGGSAQQTKIGTLTVMYTPTGLQETEEEVGSTAVV